MNQAFTECLALLLIFQCSEVVNTQNNGDLRLLQGDRADTSFSAGRLEIYINSTWGTICADNFDIIDAGVACRQLGYLGAVSTETGLHTPYGRGTGGPIWLDEVGCSDDLLHLLSCAHIGLGESDCDHFSDVAVDCIDRPRQAHPQSMDVRLTGGDFRSEGRVEVFCNDRWGAVCNQLDFQKHEANIICRELGYTEAIGYSSQESVSVEGLQVWTEQLDCPNDTSGFGSCGVCSGTNPSANDSTLTECSTVTVQCAHTVPYGSIRLAQGSETTPDDPEGRLEIFLNGVWGTVCSRTFSEVAANISCKQLGFLRTVGFQNSSDTSFGEGSGPILLDGLECRADRHQKLTECSQTTLDQEACTHAQDVAVFCTNSPMRSTTNDTSIPGNDDRKTLPTSTLIAVVVATCFVVLLCCVGCGVCVAHFYLVPYDTKKEDHGLYFIEREGSVHEETNFDQKLSDLTSPPPGKEGVGKAAKGNLAPRSKPRLTNKYVSIDTSQPAESLSPQSSDPQPTQSSAPQPVEYKFQYPADPSVPQPTSSPGTLVSPTPQQVSVHPLQLPPSPQVLHPAPSRNIQEAHKQQNSSLVFTSSFSFEPSTPSQHGSSQIDGSLNPLPKQTNHLSNSATIWDEVKPNPSHMTLSEAELQDQMRTHEFQSLSLSFEHGSTASILQGYPLTTSHAVSSPQTTPTRGIIRSPRNSEANILPNTTEACSTTQPTDSHSYHVSFTLD